ncbi:MAG: NAD(P)/FAD-dependent oxidoreductase [Candidatus Bathyarchaeia archaeon]
MEKRSQVIVVGGGPCGFFTALNLAKNGVQVEVFEEHSEVGVPSHCPGHLSIKGLKNLGLHPLPAEIIENTFYGVIFHSPKNTEFPVCFSSPLTCTVNRILFDKYVAGMAMKHGAKHYSNSLVESLIIEHDFVKGARIQQHGEKVQFHAKIVIDAEGVSSRILRMAGLSSLNPSTLVNGVHAEIENVKDVEEDFVEVFLGRSYAPGFYAWLIPKGEGKAKVGLAAKNGNPKELLRRFMFKHPVASKKLCKAKILRMAFHPIPLGGPIPKAYANGFLAVGDVASQVKPTTGGGVIFGLSCARVAAEVVFEALQKNDFSSAFLGLYQKRCRINYGFDVKVMLRIRKMLDGISDEKLDEVIRLCKRLNLNEALHGVDEIDFQGKTLLKLLRNPKMLPAILYSFFLYISANP